jgi:hypothetical protein
MRLQGGVKFPTGGRGEQSPEPASAVLSFGSGRVSRSGDAGSPIRGKLRQSWADGQSPDGRRRSAAMPGFRLMADSQLLAAFALKRLSQHVNLRGRFI